MRKKWIIAPRNEKVPEVFSDELMEKCGLEILNILFRRGLDNEEKVRDFFQFDYDRIADPFSLKDMSRAVDRLVRARDKQEKVAIYGDYDADGVTASVLLFESLKELGFVEPLLYIPDRQNEGYGVNDGAVDYLKKSGADLVVTVDCGISNRKEIARARENGLDFIITDHHNVPDEIPDGIPVINPHQKDCGYPFKDLAGVGVAFKLVQALYMKIDPERVDQLKWQLDLVAIGTVADCVPLLGENRELVKFGLIVLSKTRRVGLKEMFKVGRIAISEDAKADTEKIAFQVSPRINAAGRMDHANVSCRLMLETDPVKAREMALEVEAKNQERQKVTSEIVREVRVVAENSFKDKNLIFVMNPHWPVGLLGLVAGKICDEFQKPTAVLQDQGEEIVGSFRSIPEFDVIEAIKKSSRFLLKFGGHSQAAGVSLKKEEAEGFYSSMDALCQEALSDKDISPSLDIDLEIDLDRIGWEIVSAMKELEPFGEGNVEPVFLSRNVLVESMRIVGNGKKHLKLSLRKEGGSPKIFDAIGFSLGGYFPDLKQGDKIDVVFNLSEDEWNGSQKIQMKILDLRIAAV